MCLIYLRWPYAMIALSCTLEQEKVDALDSEVYSNVTLIGAIDRNGLALWFFSKHPLPFEIVDLKH